MGHVPGKDLSPQDEALFKAFQSNLLSLISHELRTPLTGILNAVGLLEEGITHGELDSKTLIRMARQNAQRLHRTLVTLLDLASMESGTFQARLREVDLERIVRNRVDLHANVLKDRGIAIEVKESKTSPILGDPQKLGRAIDLCLEILVPRTTPGKNPQVRISSSRVELSFYLGPALETAWEQAWSHAMTGFQGGIALPASTFAGVMQSEQAFLTRMEEGLGSEFLLIHEVMRLHGGTFSQKLEGGLVTLVLDLPELKSEEGLRAVLSSRAYQVSTELRSVALSLVRVPKNTDVKTYCAKIKENLFRASDAVYPLPDRMQVALVLDDCKPEDAPRLMQRLQTALGVTFVYGHAHCPADGEDPSGLFDLAQSRLGSITLRSR